MRRRRASRCCSSTRSRAAARRSGSSSPTRRARAGSSRSSSDRREDLEALVRDAVDRGADALAMAGGDGSQAIVAAIAAELDLPYACMPAGTRNHFALDLGVDRDDVVGALDAFVDGGERTRRPGRGQRARVRQQRLARALRRGGPARGLPRREAADAARHGARGRSAPRAAGSTCAGPGPAGTSTRRARRSSSPTTATGSATRSARAPVRGSTTACSGSRSSARRPGAASGGRLPAAAVARVVGARTSRSSADRPVARRHRRRGAACSTRRCASAIRPGVLRVRIARQHPGASPSALAPDGIRAGVAELIRIALGRD